MPPIQVSDLSPVLSVTPTGSQPGPPEWHKLVAFCCLPADGAAQFLILGRTVAKCPENAVSQACKEIFISPADISQRKTLSNMMWLCCSSSPVIIRWSNKSSHLISLALLACYTHPTTATLFLGGDCSQPPFSPGSSTVQLTLYQSVIFDNPSLCVCFLWFQSLSETLGGECLR